MNVKFVEWQKYRELTIKKIDGNTIQLNTSEENDRHRWVYVGGDKVCSFLTDDDRYKYISNMGTNLTSYSMATGQYYINFLTPHLKFIKRKRIDKDETFSTNDRSVNPYVTQFSRCGKNSFKKTNLFKIHLIYI